MEMINMKDTTKHYSITDGHAPVDLGISTNWLSSLSIKIPYGYKEKAKEYQGMRIGINNKHDEIYLCLMPEKGNGLLHLIYRTSVSNSRGSPDLSRKAKEIAHSSETLKDIMSLYLSQKEMVIDSIAMTKRTSW
jgi:hypothetical protein